MRVRKEFAVLTVLFLINVGSSSSTSGTNLYPHPLDPLSENEIRATARIIHATRPNTWVFNYITLKEPTKSSLIQSFLENKPPPKLPRKSFTILLSKNQAFEVIVNLDLGQVETWKEINSQVPYSNDELDKVDEVFRKDSEVIRRCKMQGFPNMSLIQGDQWSLGYVGDRPEYEGRRLVQLFPYGRLFETDNQYAHPFDFVVVVDLNEMKVINIEELPVHAGFDAENKNGAKVPLKPANYDPDLRDSFREDLKPVKVTNPEGVSFKIKGNEISWQKFKFRVGFNGREGPVLYQVGYQDGNDFRSLFYRLSVAELFVPYGDPRPPYHRKHVFDEGEFGIGTSITSLNPGEDMLGKAHCFDGILNSDGGEPEKIERAFCIHEEDAGILWKHTDFTGKYALVRAQRLVLTFIMTSSNYDYVFSWAFNLDASIEFNVKLTGIVSTSLLAEGVNPPEWGWVMAPQVFAQLHQHLFTLRIDADIDGVGNTVVVSDFVPVEQPFNPYGQGMKQKKTEIKTASEGRTNVAPEMSRTWLITNPSKVNPVTKGSTAWKLIPMQSPPTVTKKDSPYRVQEGFREFSTWVTQYNDEEMFPAGYYLSLNSSGLPEWVGRDPEANVEDEDVVVWFNLGLNHIPRTEDWPVMPRESCGIILQPANFFTENPSLDVPGPKKF